jgi:hypothetical protein
MLRTLGGVTLRRHRAGPGPGDGNVYFTAAAGNTRRIPRAGGAAEDVPMLQPANDDKHYYWVPVPGGNAGLFEVGRAERHVATLGPDTGTRTVVTEGSGPG